MLAAFPALSPQRQGSQTIPAGPLSDRAALYGVIFQLEALGLELLEPGRFGRTKVAEHRAQPGRAESQ